MTPADSHATPLTRTTSTAAASPRDWPVLDDVELGARVADLFTRVA